MKVQPLHKHKMTKCCGIGPNLLLTQIHKDVCEVLIMIEFTGTDKGNVLDRRIGCKVVSDQLRSHHTTCPIIGYHGQRPLLWNDHCRVGDIACHEPRDTGQWITFDPARHGKVGV